MKEKVTQRKPHIRLAAAIAIVAALAATGVRAADSDAGGAGNSAVEMKVDFVEAGRDALEAVGYFNPDRLDAAVMRERLLDRKDVEHLGPLDVCFRLDKPGVVKCVTEYIFPQEFQIQGDKVEPQAFSVRDVGAGVMAEVSRVYDNYLELQFHAELVYEPTWMNYGTSDFPMELPFFPVASFNTEVHVRPGDTFVVGGMTNSRAENADRFVLAFAKMDCVQTAVAANEATPEAGSPACGADKDNVELDVRCISVDRKALLDTGCYGTDRIEASVLLERLMTNPGARLLAAPRFVVRSGANAKVKDVVEYLYPAEYRTVVETIAEGTLPVAQPRDIKMRESGIIIDLKPTMADGCGTVDLEFMTELVDAPMWKDYGLDAKRTSSDAGKQQMLQPFFPCRSQVGNLSMKLCETKALCSGTDSQDGERLVLLFVTARRINSPLANLTPNGLSEPTAAK